MRISSHGQHCICHNCAPDTRGAGNLGENWALFRPIRDIPVANVPLFPGSTPVDGNLRRVGRR
jgi:hypothetical protein